MAAVTLGNTPSRHIIGDLCLRFFWVNGASGTTLATGQLDILWADVQQFNAAGGASVITGLAVASTGVLTFTSSATMVNEVIMVISRVG